MSLLNALFLVKTFLADPKNSAGLRKVSSPTTLLTASELDMTLDEFRQSLTATEPPAGLTHALTGLWWDGKGDWTRAHESAQQDEGVEGSWVHAYLHRKEGDQGNAAYWYSRAGKPICREPLDKEWISIVKEFLGTT